MSLLKVNELQVFNGSTITLTATTVATSSVFNSGGQLNVTGAITVTDASTTRSNLGLGTIATQDADSVTVTGGTATLGALTVSGSDSGDLVRITQTGSGNALVVEDSANPDSTPFVVNAYGRVVLGNTANIDSVDLLEQHSIGSGSSYAIGHYNWQNGGGTPQFFFNKSKSGAVGTHGVVNNGTTLGILKFTGDDGTSFIEAARIEAEVDGTPDTNDMPGRLVFSTTADGASSPTESMRIDSNGNVGIQTISPSTELDVNGDITADSIYLSENVGIGTSSPAAKLYVTGASSTNPLTLNASGSAADADRALNFNVDNVNFGKITVPTGSGGAMAFWTGSSGSVAERMRIDNSGNVGIGVNNPANLLHLQGDETYDANAGGQFSIRGTTNTSNRFNFGFETSNNYAWIQAITAGTSYRPIALNPSGGNIGIGTNSPSYQIELSTDSAGKPSTNTWTIVSDERIKEHIELADLDLCYDAVKNIPLKRFKWKDEVYSEEQVADRHKLGWIAQDVESVYPKAVNIHEFRYNQIYNETVIPAVEEELDEEGNVITEAQPERIEKELVSEDVIEDCRDLNADQIYAAMYGAVQKLIQKVESQQSTIHALTARIEALEATP